jgi:anti-sigma factor RsiW
MSEPLTHEPLTHDEAFELLPWFVNGTLSEAERTGVDRHIRACLPCRVALQEQSQLQTLLREQPTVRLSADQGFERLIEGIDAASRRRTVRPRRRGAALAALWAGFGRHAVTATVLVGGLALASWLVTIAYDRPQEGAFGTLTTEAADAARIDIVFADGVTEPELRALIRDLGGAITSGPTDRGRYTISLGSADASEREIDEVLRRLREDERVRFAGRAFIEGAAP